jgi:hypothetical protein
MALPFIEQFINHEAVLKLLIHYRCKEAESVQRVLVVDHLAVKTVRQDCGEGTIKKNNELHSLFPPRRRWVHVDYNKRKNLSQLDKNELNLYYTVLRENKNQGEHPEWYLLLNNRIERIIKAALTSERLFSRPLVSVIEKKRYEEDKTIECRPICQFKTIDERIWASLYNKVFTHLFDSLFYDNSFAFRVSKEGDPQMLHLKAVRKIKDFRTSHGGTLWVAECDMKKFYDTIDHDVIKKRFIQLLRWKKQEGVITTEEVRMLKSVIFSYVNCFNFYRDVYRYNKKPNHPIWKHIKNGAKYKKVIKWIQNDIEEKRSTNEWPYRTKHHERSELGVPQGGALSGIIANVMMHFTDIKLRSFWEDNTDFLYLRFCDDMIMMGVDKTVVESAFNRYGDSIVTNHLYMHPPIAFAGKKMKAFWDGKTRPPYQWGAPVKGVMPWITFVGYDINWEGDTRIRRSSLRKEIKKQYEKKVEIVHLLNKKAGRNPQWSKQYICNSVHKRMIGMSVGRVQIWDYKTFNNYYSWAKAFTELTDNKWSRAQLRLLDRHRNNMMKQLGRFMLKLNYNDIKPSDRREHTDAVWYYGKPFSYYGQVLKKW